MKRTLYKAALVATVLGLVSGCATTEQLAEVRSIAESAQSSANGAASRADNALSTANDALDAARNAQSTAEAATNCCNANTERLDRMVEKAMMK